MKTWKQLETTANQRAVALLRKHVAPEFLPTFDDLTLGQRLRATFQEHARAVIQRNPGFEANGPLVAIQTLRAWGIEGIDDALGKAIFEAMRVRIPESRPLFKDTLSTLAALQQRGFLLGVVSNRLWGGKPFQEDVQSLGLFNYFEPHAVAISADLGIRKPNPAIFLHALHALNVSPQEAVMVGDSLRADIAGGLSLGIFTVWKPKVVLHSLVRAHIRSAGRASASTQTLDLAPPEPGTQTGEMEAPPGMLVTDDDYMLAQVNSRDSLEQFISGEIKPDLIIEHLSELLDVFLEVGTQ